jgi:hypothetical protein
LEYNNTVAAAMSGTPGMVASHPVMIVCHWKPSSTEKEIYRGQAVWRRHKYKLVQGKRYHSVFNSATDSEGREKDTFIGIAQTTRKNEGMVTVGISGAFNVVFPISGANKRNAAMDKLNLCFQESKKLNDRRYLI